MNRNFLVQRGLSPREMLHSSKNLSEYIGHLLQHETALFGLLSEKEGPKMVMILPGVLKMLAMGSDEANLMVILKNKSSTVSISYNTILLMC
jgi:hypothetical protein